MAIRFRDGTSVFPTSTVPAHDCDVDLWFAPEFIHAVTNEIESSFAAV